MPVQDLQRFLKDYPFPIAFPAKTEVLEADKGKEQAGGLVRLAEPTLHYASLVVASNYAAADFKDEELSHRFNRFKRPLVSDFAHLLRIGVPKLKEQGKLFVPELDKAVQASLKERVHVPRPGEDGFEEIPTPLLDATVRMRNALARGLWQGLWKEFVESYTPFVLRFLELMDWCARYPLFRLLGNGQWIRLMGADPVFEPEPIPDEVLAEPAITQQEDELSGLFLFNPDEGRLLSLYPFVLWEHCPACEREPLSGLTEEVFLFNGEEGRRSAAYIGVRHARTISDHPVKERLDEIFEAKRVPPNLSKSSN